MKNLLAAILTLAFSISTFATGTPVEKKEMTQEEMKNMTPEQKKKYEEEMKNKKN